MAKELSGRDAGEMAEFGAEMGLVVEAAIEGKFSPERPVGSLVGTENGLKAEEASEGFGRQAEVGEKAAVEVAGAEVGDAGDVVDAGGAVGGEKEADGVGEGGVGEGAVSRVGEECSNKGVPGGFGGLQEVEIDEAAFQFAGRKAEEGSRGGGPETDPKGDEAAGRFQMDRGSELANDEGGGLEGTVAMGKGTEVEDEFAATVREDGFEGGGNAFERPGELNPGGEGDRDG